MCLIKNFLIMKSTTFYLNRSHIMQISSEIKNICQIMHPWLKLYKQITWTSNGHTMPNVRHMRQTFDLEL